MSNPLKQVGSRRLPPLASKQGGSSGNSSSASPKTGRQKLSKSAGGGSVPQGLLFKDPENKRPRNHDFDIESAFQQGPFRSPLNDLKLQLGNLPPPSAQNRTSDPTIFLHGLFLFYTPELYLVFCVCYIQ